MLRLLAVTAVTLLALLLGGCAMTPQSRLDEYRIESERLTAEVLTFVPEDLLTDDIITESEPRYGEAVTVRERPGDPAWWQVRTYQTLVAEADASADAAAAIEAGLTADGWSHRRVRETDGGTRFAEGYSRDSSDGETWYIEVTWVLTAPEKAELLEVLVVSPPTVRGDTSF
jgi:hypothetical protein